MSKETALDSHLPSGEIFRNYTIERNKQGKYLEKYSMIKGSQGGFKKQTSHFSGLKSFRVMSTRELKK